MRSAQESQNTADEEVKTGNDDTVSMNQILYTEKISNSQYKELQSEFNYVEEEKKSEFQSEDHREDDEFAETLIALTP
jgi:hypothetical protein